MDDFESVIDLLECPYNPAHKLLGHTMARHISRCRRAHGILKLVQCPFNPEHHVPEPEMTLHKLECEDREAFEQYKFCFTTLISPRGTRSSRRQTGSPSVPVTPSRRHAKDTLDAFDSTPRSTSAMTTRRRTLGVELPAPPPSESSPLNHSFNRVYDLRTTCRSARKDSSPSASPSVEKKLPTATVVPLRSETIAPREDPYARKDFAAEAEHRRLSEALETGPQ
ncbi:AGAP011542-PA-like protein [Anopheles sinensis]|uniref:AGAP011542-PA-like protein n=1 Tax=Anopheles sinensis TaxID=74873 RepID=A0A084VRK6_ANOSI|nr:AGAP011542-PA-like protein [Anopheles sinensis]